jgi:DDE superfamily endonuclease
VDDLTASPKPTTPTCSTRSTTVYGPPIVLVWDNLNTHVSAALRTLIAARDWLTVIRLPAYARDLNPPKARGCT